MASASIGRLDRLLERIQSRPEGTDDKPLNELSATPLYQKTQELDRLADLLNRPRVSAMAENFLAPLLHGMVCFGVERGSGVSSFWEDQFGWRGITNLEGYCYTADDTGWPPSVPLILLNASDVERGNSVVIGFPPVPPSASKDAVERVVDITALHPGCKLSLADAVRLSANVPWVFEIGAVDSAATRSAAYRRTEVIDGGVTDNSGFDSVRMVLNLLASRADTDSSTGDSAQIAVRCKQLLAAFRERGVVLLEIDSGKRLGPATWLETAIYPGLLRPKRALERAIYSTADEVKDGFVRQMKSALHEKQGEGSKELLTATPASDSTVNFHHVTITCDRNAAIMTAWALGLEDKAQLLLNFYLEQEQTIEQLQRIISAYQSRRAN